MFRLLALVVLAGCVQTADPLPVAAGVFWLVSIDGQPFEARATISFPTPETVSGNAPCNSYGGALTEPLPAFVHDGFISTEMACDDLGLETVFFAALSAMTRADLGADGVILSNAGGRRMVFVQP